MVRSLYRIFLIAGIVSVFSFGYVNDAVASFCDRNHPAGAGNFCKDSTVYPCRKGCWCEGKGKSISSIAVDKVCSGEKDPTKDDLDKLEKADVHLCFANDVKEGYSAAAAKEASECGVGTCNLNAGEYCDGAGFKAQKCPKGCWCEGGRIRQAVRKYNQFGNNNQKFALESHCKNHNDHNNTYNAEYLEERGVHYCPLWTTTSGTGAKSEGDCNKGSDNDCTSQPWAGRYCYRKDRTHPKCPKGCYCPGGKKFAVKDGAGADHEYWEHVSERCADHMQEAEEYLNSRGIYYCPEGYTDGEEVVDIDGCYRENNNGERVYYEEESENQEPGNSSGTDLSGKPEPYGVDLEARASLRACKAGSVWCLKGQYLPKNKDACETCKAGYYCPKADCYTKEPSSDKGIESCPASNPNSDKGQSEKEKCYCKTSNERLNYYPNSCTAGGGQGVSGNGIICEDGKYYDGDGNCVPCPAGAYCRDGKARKCGPRGFSAAGKSKCTECGNGYMANEDSTGCERALITVPAGMYLPKGSVTPEGSCPANNFCPGGKWLYSSGSNKGAFDCPPLTSLSGSPSDDRKDCNLNLTKEQMSYGIAGNKKCWEYVTKENYVNCIFAGSGTIESIEDDEGITWNEEALVETDEVVVDHTSDGNYNNSGTTPAVPTGSENLRTPAGKKDDFKVTNDNGKSLAVSTGNAEVGTANTTDYVAQAPDTLKQVSPGEPVKATPLSNATMVGGKNLTASPARSLRPTRSVRKR